MLIIGSFALNHHAFRGLLQIPVTSIWEARMPKDLDIIVTPDEFKEILDNYMSEAGRVVDIIKCSPSSYALKLKNGSINEYVIAYPGDSNDLILKYSNNEIGKKDYASPEVLLMLKMSHRFKKNSPHFKKTMADIRFLRDELGISIPEDLQAIYKMRMKETYTYAHPSLAQSKEEFFVKDESFYVWDHDDIHLAVKTLPDKPAYQYFQPEGSEVQTSKKMWDECSLDVKLRAGLEESYVLALERSLVPKPGVLTPKQAFNKALEKVCTSITSGWFREFCWEHYHEIQALYNNDFVDKFQEALANGRLKPFTKTTFPLGATND